MGAQLPNHVEMPLRHLYVSIYELNHPFLPPPPAALEVSETKVTHDYLGGFKRFGSALEELEPMVVSETASGYAWDRHTYIDRCCVCEVLVPSTDKSHLTLARSFLHECRLLYPP